MRSVSITFDPKPTLNALHQEVNVVSAELVLGNNAVTSVDNLKEDINFKPAIKRRWTVEPRSLHRPSQRPQLPDIHTLKLNRP
jgi:hypothetical protein